VSRFGEILIIAYPYPSLSFVAYLELIFHSDSGQNYADPTRLGSATLGSTSHGVFLKLIYFCREQEQCANFSRGGSPRFTSRAPKIQVILKLKLKNENCLLIISNKMPNIRYPVFREARYPAKSVSGVPTVPIILTIIVGTCSPVFLFFLFMQTYR